MKVIGYGWIKSGDTLQSAMELYGVPDEIKSGQQVIKSEKGLFDNLTQVRRDFKKAVEDKKHRKSAKPRYFRLIVQEIE